MSQRQGASKKGAKDPSSLQRLEQMLMAYGKARRVSNDEMLASGDGHLIRDHWAPLMRSLGRYSEEELEGRSHEAKRLMRESGVTYNIYNDPEGRSRVWQLDPVPMLLGQDDWQDIEEGLVQRARLMNLVFKDIYGEQRLIKDGLLPAELVFSHRGYLRSCQGLYGADEQPLFNYSADLARGPDGRMWVFSDRTQAPSGAGYALETRIAMSRVMAPEFRDNKVRRLSHYFRAMRAALANLPASRRGEPRIVLMTPGPLNETYFEHAYLSAYLGYTLVQGEDLTVRDGKVWLKSIDGLRRVDVIVRRVDDAFCDPLELREDSHLGVPGLVQAVREGNVTVVNPLGSGIMESPGLYPFMDAIAKRLLDEELQMPCAASWWCGQKKERDYVLEHLDSLVIKAVDRRFGTVFGGTLSEAERQALRERIIAQPNLYVGQERLACSTTPSLIEGEVLPRRVLFRSFLVASEGSYSVMPGGLTRIAPDNVRFLITNQTGGISKDTWILTDQPDRQLTLLPDPSAALRKLENDTLLPSRSAENLYWVGRYAERAEGIVRLLRTLLKKLSDYEDYQDEVDQACLVRMLGALTHLTETYPGFVEPEDDGVFASPQAELLETAFAKDRPGSLVSTMRSLHFGAFNVRDLWSADTWRTIDEIGELAADMAKRRPGFSALHYRLDTVIDHLMSFSGLTQESMSHESGWFMFDLGKRLERAMQIVKLTRSLLGEYHGELDELLNIEALMSSQESLATYRRRYRLSSSAVAAIALLVLDEHHPRSVAFQLEKIREHFRYLPRQVRKIVASPLNSEEKLLLKLRTNLQLSEADALVQVDESSGRRGALQALLADIETDLSRISDDITHRYFSHTDYGRQLAPQVLPES